MTLHPVLIIGTIWSVYTDEKGQPIIKANTLATKGKLSFLSLLPMDSLLHCHSTWHYGKKQKAQQTRIQRSAMQWEHKNRNLMAFYVIWFWVLSFMENPGRTDRLLPLRVSEEFGNAVGVLFLDQSQILETEKLSPLLEMLILFPSASPSATDFPFCSSLHFNFLALPPPLPVAPFGRRATCSSRSLTTYWYEPIEKHLLASRLLLLVLLLQQLVSPPPLALSVRFKFELLNLPSLTEKTLLWFRILFSPGFCTGEIPFPPSPFLENPTASSPSCRSSKSTIGFWKAKPGE